MRFERRRIELPRQPFDEGEEEIALFLRRPQPERRHDFCAAVHFPTMLSCRHAHQCPRHRIASLLSRSHHRFLSRWLLPHRPGGCRPAHRLRAGRRAIFSISPCSTATISSRRIPEYGFPGLKPGDRWCVCVTRWKAALKRGLPGPVDLEATHSSALEFVTLEELKAHAIQSERALSRREIEVAKTRPMSCVGVMRRISYSLGLLLSLGAGRFRGRAEAAGRNFVPPFLARARTH